MNADNKQSPIGVHLRSSAAMIVFPRSAFAYFNNSSINDFRIG